MDASTAPDPVPFTPTRSSVPVCSPAPLRGCIVTSPVSPPLPVLLGLVHSQSLTVQPLCCLITLPNEPTNHVLLSAGGLARALHVCILELYEHDLNVCPTLDEPASVYTIIPAQGFPQAPFSLPDVELVARILMRGSEFVAEFTRTAPAAQTLQQRYAAAKAASVAASTGVDLSSVESALVASARDFVHKDHRSDPFTADAATSVKIELTRAYAVVAEVYSLLFAGEGNVLPDAPPPPPLPPILLSIGSDLSTTLKKKKDILDLSNFLADLEHHHPRLSRRRLRSKTCSQKPAPTSTCCAESTSILPVPRKSFVNSCTRRRPPVAPPYRPPRQSRTARPTRNVLPRLR